MTLICVEHFYLTGISMFMLFFCSGACGTRGGGGGGVYLGG
jgi:hypothetical protein